MRVALYNGLPNFLGGAFIWQIIMGALVAIHAPYGSYADDKAYPSIKVADYGLCVHNRLHCRSLLDTVYAVINNQRHL
jgi:hypothetical protein